MRRVIVAILGAVTLAAPVAADQSAATAPASGLVVGASGSMTPIVGDLEEAARFYTALLQLPEVPRILRRSHEDVPYPEVLKNQGTPDATIRQINVRIPGSRWQIEVLEFSDIERASTPIRLQDPGAVTLVLQVRDVDALLAKLKEGKYEVITPGGQPVTVTTGDVRARAVVIRAPGGHFIEIEQRDPLPAVSTLPAGNIIGARVRVTIEDTDATLRLYRDRFGFRPDVGSFSSEPSRLALMGMPKARFRLTSSTVPGNPQQVLEFIEFADVERRVGRPRIQDVGSAKIQLHVSDIASAIAALKQSDGVVATTGGTSMIYRGLPTAIVRDLNNIFINLQEPAAHAASIR